MRANRGSKMLRAAFFGCALLLFLIASSLHFAGASDVPYLAEGGEALGQYYINSTGCCKPAAGGRRFLRNGQSMNRVEDISGDQCGNRFSVEYGPDGNLVCGEMQDVCTCGGVIPSDNCVTDEIYK
jgi:hypothetical protein